MSLGIRSFTRIGLCLALWSAVGLFAAGSGASAAPSLTATAVFDQSNYVTGQQVSVKLSVHNSGTRDAVGISAEDNAGSTELVPDERGFGRLSNRATIPAGHTVTVTVSGNLRKLTASKVTFAGFLYDRSGHGVASFSAKAPVTVRTATVRGQVFGDANANGRANNGEGLRGATVRLTYLYGGKPYTATTGRGGRFTLVVPTALYRVDGSAKGWDVIPRMLTVHGHGAAPSVRAVRPLDKTLTASMHFTKTHYARGAKVHITITLDNTGPDRLYGIGAECARAGNPNELRNTGRGWGHFAADGRGVILAPHTKRIFHVTDRVPAAAHRAGQVEVACDFGYPQVDGGYRPAAFDTAKVAGLSGALAGQVGYYVHGNKGTPTGLKNVRVVLANPSSCPVFTRTATTNAKGRFRFGTAPAGDSYYLYFYPPKGWKMRDQNPTRAMVIGNDTTNFFLEVRRGSAPTPTVPTKCA